MPHIDAMISPSAHTIQETYRALGRLIAEIDNDSQAVEDTLQLTSDILNALGSSANLRGSWVNPITLPIPVAMKAISAAVSRYVERRTGFSVTNWAEFVNTSRTQIEDYLIQLQQLAELARASDGLSTSPSDISTEQLQQDRELLEETKRKTAMWQPVIARLTKLYELAQSMLEAAEEETTQDMSLEPDRKGWLRKVEDAKRMIGDAVDHVRDKYQEQLATLLSPLRDLCNRARQLNGQVSKLEQSMSRLRYLIDLEIAQIRAALGEIAEEELENLGKRIAVNIVVPQLREQLTAAGSEADAFRDYLQRLERRHRQGDVRDEAYEALAHEYQVILQAATSRANTLQKQADVWKKQGIQVLRTGRLWLEKEIEIVTARELVGEIDQSAAQKRRLNLTEELERFAEAQNLVLGL
jgi:hypothetical protein